jgi:hypothetical protein
MQFSTSKFHWSPDMGLFSQELSSLGIKPHQNAFHQLYSDACDEGITLISEVTHKEANYFVDSVDQDEDGDIQGWNLLPTTETLRELPILKNTRVLLIND